MDIVRTSLAFGLILMLCASGSARERPVPPDEAPLEAYRCAMECDGAEPLQARSEAEAAWLVRHGYPTPAQQQRLRALSREEIKREADAGSPPAAVELGRRVALEDHPLDGRILLREQAAKGNIYAYYALSEISEKAAPPSLVDSAAYLRMAYMQGDHKAALEIVRMRLTSAERVEADKRASHLHAGYAGGQLRDPRPQE